MKVLVKTLVFWAVLPLGLLAQGGSTFLDVEYDRICLVDSVAPDTMTQFWRYTAANKPGEFRVDMTFDLSGPYTVAGTVISCCDCLTGYENRIAPTLPVKKPDPVAPGIIAFLTSIALVVALALFFLSLLYQILRQFAVVALLFLPFMAQAQPGGAPSTFLDVEFDRICLVDSVAPDTMTQFWRYTMANKPGEYRIDMTYDLSGPYTVAGTVIRCDYNEVGFGGITINHNDGNILWVSSDGNNTTARRGDMEFPYADPWAAKSNAQNGDLIIVLSGRWTFGPTSSGADVEFADVDSVNLIASFDSINYHFMPGTRIEKVGPAFGNANPRALFYFPNAGKYVISGNGEFSWGYSGVFQNSVIQVDNAEADVSFSCELMTYGTFGLAAYKFRNINLNVNKVRPESPSVAFISFRERDTLENVNFTCHIKDYNNFIEAGGNTDFSGIVASRAAGTNVAFKNSNLNFKFDNIIKYDPLGVTGAPPGADFANIGGLVHDSELIGSSFNLEVGNVLYRDLKNGATQSGDTTSTVSSSYVSQPAFVFSRSKCTRSSYRLKVGNMISDFPCLAMNFQLDINGDGGEYYIDGNFQTDSTYCMILQGATDSTNYVHITGSLISGTHPAIGDRRSGNSRAKIQYENCTVVDKSFNPSIRTIKTIVYQDDSTALYKANSEWRWEGLDIATVDTVLSIQNGKLTRTVFSGSTPQTLSFDRNTGELDISSGNTVSIPTPKGDVITVLMIGNSIMFNATDTTLVAGKENGGYRFSDRVYAYDYYRDSIGWLVEDTTFNGGAPLNNPPKYINDLISDGIGRVGQNTNWGNQMIWEYIDRNPYDTVYVLGIGRGARAFSDSLFAQTYYRDSIKAQIALAQAADSVYNRFDYVLFGGYPGEQDTLINSLVSFRADLDSLCTDRGTKWVTNDAPRAYSNSGKWNTFIYDVTDSLNITLVRGYDRDSSATFDGVHPDVKTIIAFGKGAYHQVFEGAVQRKQFGLASGAGSPDRLILSSNSTLALAEDVPTAIPWTSTERAGTGFATVVDSVITLPAGEYLITYSISYDPGVNRTESACYVQADGGSGYSAQKDSWVVDGITSFNTTGTLPFSHWSWNKTYYFDPQVQVDIKVTGIANGAGWSFKDESQLIIEKL